MIRRTSFRVAHTPSCSLLNGHWWAINRKSITANIYSVLNETQSISMQWSPARLDERNRIVCMRCFTIDPPFEQPVFKPSNSYHFTFKLSRLFSSYFDFMFRVVVATVFLFTAHLKLPICGQRSIMKCLCIDHMPWRFNWLVVCVWIWNWFPTCHYWRSISQINNANRIG